MISQKHFFPKLKIEKLQQIEVLNGFDFCAVNKIYLSTVNTILFYTIMRQYQTALKVFFEHLSAAFFYFSKK